MTRATLNTNAVAAAQSTHPQSAGDGNKSGTNNEMPAPAAPSAAAEPPAAPLAPRVQDLVLRVSQPDAPNVDLQVTQRQGQVHIAVRTPDASLQTALRQNLPDLVNSLDRAGFRAETFVPHAGSGVAAMGQAASGNLSQDTSGQPQSQGSGSSGDQFANSDGRRRHSQPNQPQSQQQSSGKSTQDRLAESWRKQMEE